MAKQRTLNVSFLAKADNAEAMLALVQSVVPDAKWITIRAGGPPLLAYRKNEKPVDAEPEKGV